MNKVTRALGLIALGMTMATAASAGPLVTPTQTVTFNDPGTGNLDFTQTITFDGFDSSLGILDSVHFTLTITSQTLNNDIVNLNPAAVTIGSPVPASAIATVSVTGPGALSTSNTLTTPGFTGSVAPFPPAVTVGTASITSVVSVSDVLLTPFEGGTDDVSGYIGGTNSVSLTFSGVGTQGGSVPSGVFTGNNGTVVGSLSIFYDYHTVSTNVPVPAPLFLMGAGVMGMAAARRRKAAA